MASLFQQLQGDDTLLLMYLTGELPASDHAEVERRVAGDAKLRADLDRLTEVYGSFTSGMEALDASTPIGADVSAAVRRASTAIRQWQARPAPALTYGVDRRPSRLWRVWAVPSAAAAIVLVVVGIALYSSSVAKRPLVLGPRILRTPVGPVVPAAVSPQADETAQLIVMFTPTAGNSEPEAMAEVTGPSFDPDVTRDESDRTPHEDGAVFNVPLP